MLYRGGLTGLGGQEGQSLCHCQYTLTMFTGVGECYTEG